MKIVHQKRHTDRVRLIIMMIIMLNSIFVAATIITASQTV